MPQGRLIDDWKVAILDGRLFHDGHDKLLSEIVKVQRRVDCERDRTTSTKAGDSLDMCMCHIRGSEKSETLTVHSDSSLTVVSFCSFVSLCSSNC